jgi:uncharacterized phiE125 gp8 family phage protein
MSIKIITPVASELISVAEAAEFLRIDSYSSETTTISAFITAARQWCEEYLGRSIGVQTLELVLERFPSKGIVLPAPLVSITSIKYLDTSNVEQTIAAADYYVAEDQDPPTVKHKDGSGAWPSTLNVDDAVRVRFQAGYQAEGDSPLISKELPNTIKIAMLMIIVDLYENRTAQVDYTLSSNPTVERLLSMYRLEMGI